jgi:hypothetical protein
MKHWIAPRTAPLIPESFTPEFLTVVIDLAKARQAWNRANPVATYYAGGLQMRVEHRQAEMARLVGIILAASTLIEPEAHDDLYLEIAASDLEAYLDEDMGMMERQALAIVRENGR